VSQNVPSAWSSIEELQQLFLKNNYLADRGLATAVHLSAALGKPLFLEGEAGVGKTEVANVLARVLDTELVRLQCYEGITVAQAMYDWNYPRQFLSVRASEAAHERSVAIDDLFSEEFLIERPLLKALRSSPRAVLLIDEVDRADDEFEAFLLELLSDNSMTIPEIGTIRAKEPPLVVLTSNRTREVHDALKRRCFYHVVTHPDMRMETRIILLRVPGAVEELARQVAHIVAKIRGLSLAKPPGVAEAIDWTSALAFLGVKEVGLELARETIGAVIKQEDDLEVVVGALPEILVRER
jgi:MoxR-like ATPase